MIVVFGTINVDMVTVMERFPVPGETVKGRDYQIFPGGKGANQALSAARSGAKVMLVGAVGNDPFADIALANLRKAGVDLSGVRRADQPTGLFMIAIDPTGENLMIGANAANDAARAVWLEGRFGPGVTFVTQNSLGTTDVEIAIAMARRAGSRVVYNAAPAEPVGRETFAAADIVIVNEHEQRRYGALLGIDGAPASFARTLARELSTNVVVTLGPRGIVAAEAGGRMIAGAPPPIIAVDSTGAGDAFCGALAAALDRGAPFERALKEGLAAGSLACRESGAQTSFRDLTEISALADGLVLVPA